MPEPSRAARIAAQLEQRGMLLPGVTAHHLGCDVYEDTPGLQDGPDADFDAALEAYVKVCHESNVDKSATQAWQRYCKAPFAEALMDLVAVFRTSLAADGSLPPEEAAAPVPLPAELASTPAGQGSLGKGGEALAPVDAEVSSTASGDSSTAPSTAASTAGEPRKSTAPTGREALAGRESRVDRKSSKSAAAEAADSRDRANSFGRKGDSKLSKISRSLSWNTRKKYDDAGAAAGDASPL